mmetsp:Transcript_31711/g.66688  ORF Transcript_31711/g.66688 Transcript_31711/m.66688 type:complete len:123 (+) Transcript_31711:1088-1456(+)
MMPAIKDLILWHWKKGFSFAFVYIEEAHAVDEWPISEAGVDIRQHKSLKERRDAANTLLSHFGGLPFEIYLDNMNNSFNSSYPSWPFRFWVITKQRVVFKAMPKSAAYHLEDLDECMNNFDF